MTAPTVETSPSPAWSQFVASWGGSGARAASPVSLSSARSIPSVGRAVQTIAGMAKQMPLDAYKGPKPIPRSRLLHKPDPERGRTLPWWLGQQVADYLLNGNALHYVTSRNPSTGLPTSALYLPASLCSVAVELGNAAPSYWYGGTRLSTSEVVHVQRDADPLNPWRGLGVVEQHMSMVSRVLDQEAYEADVMRTSAVPSVLITSPNPEVSQEEADEARSVWEQKYGGGQRVPAVLPAGTTVTPLAWSPHDAQLSEVRKMSLLDVANAFNLDGYWLGAPAAGMTYKNISSLYLNLLRQTVNPVLVELEAAWSEEWLYPGEDLRFDRSVVLRDDLAGSIAAMAAGTAAKLYTIEEGRTYLGLPPEYPEGHTVATTPAPAPGPSPEPEADPEEEDQTDATS